MVRRWLELVCRTYTQSPESEWNQFTSSLTEAVRSSNVDVRVAEEFIQHLTANDPRPF